MDKVRVFVRAVWQQRFWVLSIVGVVIAAVCWMMAAGKLQAEFTTNKVTINTKFGDMDKIRNTSVHGNDSVNDRERQEAIAIKEGVKKLWQKLYETQRTAVLYWPKVLSEDFLRDIEEKKFGANIKSDFRNLYLNYIKNQFDALVAIVDAQKMPDLAGGAVGGDYGRSETPSYSPTATPGMAPEEFLVQWLDQGELKQKLTFARQPTSLQIWVTQEDLWVYETLLTAIANTNKARGATRPDNTAIRVIGQLQVGSKAAIANKERGNILMPQGAPAEGGAMPEGGGAVGAPDGRGEYMAGMPGAEGTNVDAMLLASRYIDETGAPIADATPENVGGGTAFRRLPVRMVLQMDQRWIPKILVECANATLPIEVQRVRVNHEKSGLGFDSLSAGGTGGGEYGRGGGGDSGSGGYGRGGAVYGRGGGDSGGGMGMYGGGAMAMPPAPTADLATVEIQGLVYIYNPPDAASLTVPGEEEAAAAEATEVAAVP